MSRPDSERRSKWPAVVLGVFLLLLPVLYILSVGPAFWLMDEQLQPYAVIYTPLFRAADSSRTFERLLFWYLSLFID
jgi:hypothetical protein